MEMADRIKERRKIMGFTQTELGEKLGLQASAIAKYENGRVENIKRSIIADMAKVLECSPAYLMGWSDSIDGKGEHKVYMEIKATSKSEAIHIAVKNMLTASGDAKRASTITEAEALELYRVSGFDDVQIVDGSETIAAHKDGENFTPEELKRIEEYKKLLIAARPKE